MTDLANAACESFIKTLKFEEVYRHILGERPLLVKVAVLSLPYPLYKAFRFLANAFFEGVICEIQTPVHQMTA